MCKGPCCSYIAAALMWVFAAGGLAVVASAAQEPPSISRLAGKTTPLTSQEQAQVRSYAEWWVAQLASGEPEAMDRARRRLREPLSHPGGVSPIFRDEYSRAAIPILERRLGETRDNMVVVNILQVAAVFGTEQALRFLVNRTDPDREERVAARLWAARGFETTVRSEVIDERRLPGFARDLARAAGREEHWNVLYRQFEALAAVPESTSQQIQVLSTVLDRIEGNAKPNPSMQAIQRACVLLRDQYLRMGATQQRQVGVEAGPVLGQVFRAAEKHWDVAHADEQARQWYLDAIRSTEIVLRLMHAPMGAGSTPNTDLAAAWERDDRAAFTRDLQQWDRVLSRAPYRR